MQVLVYRHEERGIEERMVPELRSFFRRVHRVRQELGVRPYLNRLQRRRCRENLLILLEREREFHAVEYREDFRELHRQLRRWLYLESGDLARVLAEEELERRSLFLPVA